MKSIPILFLLAVVQVAANLPHRVKVLKQKKDQAIYSSLSLVYNDYTRSLLRLQTDLVASNRLRDANTVQSEFFLNSSYLDLIGKSYQFVFAPPKPLPNEGKIFRETRNEKVKIALRKSLTQYIQELNKAQSLYMSNQNRVDARKTTDEMRLATLELSKVEAIDSGTNSVSLTLNAINRPKKSFNLGDGVQLNMNWVYPGSFIMGSPKTEPERAPTEFQKKVTIKKGFYLGKFEVTQAEYEIIMKGNDLGINPRPSHFANHPDYPVENISLDEVEIFINRLNNQLKDRIELREGLRFALPTEEQWEYACRAGTRTAYSFGSKITSSNANYNLEKDEGKTKKVGSYLPNNWGFYDMHGNVWEITSSVFETSESPSELFVRKGGSWWSKSINIRSARRLQYSTTLRFKDIGFRVCLAEVK